MKIRFVETPGNNKAVDMLVDGHLIQEDIPYIPSKATDHRGTAVYLFLLDTDDDIEIDEIDFGNTENLSEVIRAHEYMYHPWHVKESVNERLNKIPSKKKYN